MKKTPPELLLKTLDAVKAAGGNRAHAAKALGIGVTTVKNRLALAREAGMDAPPLATKTLGQAAPAGTQATKSQALGRLAALLEKSGIDLEEIGRVEKIRLSEWDGFSKDADGQPVVTRLQAESIVLTPKWADGPAWPVIHRAPEIVTTRRHAGATPDRAHKVCVVLPDIQINYFRGKDGALIPTHDEQCLSIALDIIEDADPDVVAMNGDNLDLSELSKYRKFPIFQQMTQPTIDRAARLLASIRARVRPECRIMWLEGNHELRMSFYVLDNAMAAHGLKRANAPESWPVLSVPYLCRFDDYGVEYVSGYPANGFMLNDNLEIAHGNKAKSNGSTAQSYLTELRHSFCYGHTHREEVQTVTRKTVRGPRTYEAFSFGCLCRTDGRVPSVGSGYDIKTGQPVKTQENWTNGLGVIEYDEGDGDFWREHVRIWHGMTRWRGKTYAAPHPDVEAA